MVYEVVIGPIALEDLERLHEYIADRSGLGIADGFIDRIERACAKLEDFPARGTPRDELQLGLRSIAVERRVTIAYSIDGRVVLIESVFYGGRDPAAAFARRDQ